MGVSSDSCTQPRLRELLQVSLQRGFRVCTAAQLSSVHCSTAQQRALQHSSAGLQHTLSSQKIWEEPLLVSNSLRASAMVPKALKGSVGTYVARDDHQPDAEAWLQHQVALLACKLSTPVCC